MAWVDVPGTNSVWEYENTATAANTYADAPGTYSGGIRTFTQPGTSLATKVYARCRKKGETVERGELSKDFYDATHLGF